MVIVASYESNYQIQPALLKVPVNLGSVYPIIFGSTSEVYLDPAISPDGQKVAFVKQSYSDTTSGLWMINVDGSGLKRLTTDRGDRCPAFSPNGSQIVFERTTGSYYPSYYYSQFGRTGNIYLINVDGSDLTPVTVNGGSWPTWIQ
jgi:Tol biopolymer transport system component